MKKILILILCAVVLGTIAFVIYRGELFRKPTDDEQIPLTQSGSDNEYYFNEEYRYRIHLPKDMKIERLTPYTMQMTTKMIEPGVGPANYIYISVVPATEKNNEGEIYGYRPDHYKKLQSLAIGEKVAVTDEDQEKLEKYFTYTRIADTTINGITARVFENTQPWEFPRGTTETRYIFELSDTIYILGSYTGGNNRKDTIDPQVAVPLIKSFSIGSS